MPLKKMDVDSKTVQKLLGTEVVYTVRRPFSSRYRRESIYMGKVERMEGNNIIIKNERDLIREKTRETQIRSLMEFEELYKKQ
jgi:hypothetical protein